MNKLSQDEIGIEQVVGKPGQERLVGAGDVGCVEVLPEQCVTELHQPVEDQVNLAARERVRQQVDPRARTDVLEVSKRARAWSILDESAERRQGAGGISDAPCEDQWQRACESIAFRARAPRREDDRAAQVP